MKSNHKFSLVKEAYALEEARELLMSLVSGTIRFHSLESLRSWEQKGNPNKHSEKRLQELSELREAILKMISDLDGENVSVEINAEIKVSDKK